MLAPTPNALSVSQLSNYLKQIIDNDLLLSNIQVIGEVSNARPYNRGQQVYFTLKDNHSQINCVVFSNVLARIKCLPTDGMQVMVRGKVSIYAKRGQYSLQVYYLEVAGAGELANAFERLKEKLLKEGLFEQSRKKALPRYPEKVLVIAAETGAAVRDIMSIGQRRCPLTEIMLMPATVQGALAPASLVKALSQAPAIAGIEVVIVARGGGSAEDLWAFNDENVVRAVADCPLPVISAVGHETDTTLTDYAADLRAPTPSAAAELLIPDLAQIAENFKTALKIRLINKYRHNLQHFIYLKEKIALLNPQAILARGYAITKYNGQIVRAVDALKQGTIVTTILHQGQFNSQIIDVEK